MARTIVDAGVSMDIFEASAVGELDRVLEHLRLQPVLANAYADDGFTPLGLAAYFGHVDVARALINAGADVNAASYNNLRVAPLHSAIAGRHAALSRLLIERGADVNAKQQDDFTPLIEAAQNGDLETVILLLERGAARHAVTAHSQSALDLAAAAGHQQVVDTLRGGVA